jgi:hypothetical protein
MTPTQFPQANTNFTAPESMPDCGDLPTFRGSGQIISCWKMSWKERLKALITGKVWLGVAGSAQPPVWLATQSPFPKK